MEPTLGTVLIKFLEVINTPLGVTSLVILVFGLMPRLPKLQRFIASFMPQPQPAGGMESLKPILQELTDGIQKVSNNDLSHVQKAIDKISEKMDNFDDKLAKHDKQAGIILVKQKETCRRLDDLCNRPAVAG